MLDRAAAAGATVIAAVGDEHGWRLGRIVDPFHRREPASGGWSQLVGAQTNRSRRRRLPCRDPILPGDVSQHVMHAQDRVPPAPSRTGPPTSIACLDSLQQSSWHGTRSTELGDSSGHLSLRGRLARCGPPLSRACRRRDMMAPLEVSGGGVCCQLAARVLVWGARPRSTNGSSRTRFASI